MEIEVHASARIAGNPSSVADVPSWGNVFHECRMFFGSRICWQGGLELPAEFGRGDVLVLNGNPRFLSSLVLAVRARLRGAGVVWWGHAWSPTSVPWRAAIRYKFMALADVVLFYTTEEADRFPVLSVRKRAFGLNNTIDIAPIDRAAGHWSVDLLRAFQEEAGLADGKVLLFCGRLRAKPETELDVAIRALVQLRECDKANRYVLVVVGAGEDEARLRALAEKLGVNNLIRWLGAIYDEEKLAPYFKSALCCLYPGSVGLALMHALAYGVPVVTHAERMRHGPEIAALVPDVNGLTFARGDSAELARQVVKLASDAEFRLRLSAAAERTVRQEFSFCGMVERFEEAILLAAKASIRT